jgi:glycosyltransferase involved in cell wall biosynthesis
MRALIVHNFYRHRGGEDRTVEIERAALERAGVEIVTQFSDSRDLEPRNPVGLAMESVWSMRAAAELAHAIEHTRPQIVHFHNVFPLPSPAALRAAKGPGRAVVRTLHNYRTLCANALLLRDGYPCEKCVGHSFGWPALVHACYRERRDATIAVTAANFVQYLQRRRDDPVDRYVALSDFAAARFRAGGYDPSRLAVAPPILIDPGPPTSADRQGILWVGRVSAEKGLDTLAEVWRELDLTLEIVGDGPEATALRADASAAWRWHGELSPEGVAEKMRAAAILVFPSRAYENFGLTLAEAMSHGMAIVASDRGASAEMLAGGAGLLVPPDDPRAWREAIQCLAREPVRVASLGKAARARFEAEYAPARAVARRIALYRDLAGSAA